jgi:FemAB-related protein (PEP-CTERM system-associated)
MMHATKMQGDMSRTPSLSAVKYLDEDRRGDWDAFVRGHSDGTFYHLSGWQNVIDGFLRHPTYYMYIERDGRIEGVLPIARVRSWLFGDALISMPFLVYGGVLAGTEQAAEKLISAATELADDLGVDYLELRNRSPQTDWPSKNTYVTFRKNIASDSEENLKAIPRKQRAMVRKGIKACLHAEMDADARRLYAVLSECKRNLGTPFFGRNYLQKIADTFRDECEILTVTHEGDCIASVMSFRFRDEVLPYYGGGVSRAREFSANDFLYWKVMERAALDEVRVFDYGRSRVDTGPYRFKKHWGFEPEPLSYEFYLVNATEIPQLDPDNRRYRAMINAWRHLPLLISRIAGPPIARRLG